MKGISKCPYCGNEYGLIRGHACPDMLIASLKRAFDAHDGDDFDQSIANLAGYLKGQLPTGEGEER